MLQCTEAERLGNKEGLLGDAWISLGKGHRRDFLSGLRIDGEGNMSDQVEMGYRAGSIEKDHLKWRAFGSQVKTSHKGISQESTQTTQLRLLAVAGM